MADLPKKKNELDTKALYGATRKEIEGVLKSLKKAGKYIEGSFEIIENKSLKRLEVYENDIDGKFMTGLFPLGGVEELVVGSALKYLRQSMKDQAKENKNETVS